MRVGVHKGHESVSGLSELELQTVMRCLLWVLGTRLRKNSKGS